jgi:hypothetical protein
MIWSMDRSREHEGIKGFVRHHVVFDFQQNRQIVKMHCIAWIFNSHIHSQVGQLADGL